MSLRSWANARVQILGRGRVEVVDQAISELREGTPHN